MGLSHHELEARARETRRAFLESLKSPGETDRRLLLEECVAANANTDFGRAHDFASIKTIDDYRRNVPIRMYDDLAPWIERAAKGEPRVLTHEEVVAFNRTSGTRTAAKKIPVTRSWVQRERDARTLFWGNILTFCPDVFSRDDNVLNLIVDTKPEADTVTEGGIPFLPVTVRTSRDPLLALPGSNAPWIPGADVVASDKRAYHVMRVAAEYDAIVVAMAINPSTLVTFAQNLAAQSSKIIEEIAAGTIDGAHKRAPNPARAEVLRRLVKEHGALKPEHVWPSLRVLACWKSGSCRLYIPRVRSLWGEHLESLPAITMASEGPLALPVDRHPEASMLALGFCFFEFLPVGEELRPDAKTLLFHELEVGGEYEAIVTQPSGLYRYALRDIFKVVEYVDGVPRVDFMGRRDATSSFTGEKLTEPQIMTAMQAAYREVKLDVLTSTCIPVWGDPPHYAFVVETHDAISDDVSRELAAALDREIARANDEYPGKRANNRLGPVRVHGVTVGTFARWRAQLAARGAHIVQMKERVIQKDAAPLAELVALGGARAEAQP